MRWIKLFGNALNDKRLLNLRNDHGFLGIGVYYALLSHVECLGEGMQHIDQLKGLFNGKVSRKMVLKILTSYDLSAVNTMGIARSKGRIPGYTAEDLLELRRTDAPDPSAGTTHECEDETIQEEIITTMRFRRPSVDEVRAYCQERHNSVDAEQFVDYYESKGWRVGHNPMKDGKACVRTWERKRVHGSRFMVNGGADEDNFHKQSSLNPKPFIQDGPPIPDDAPPRPSSRAQWDFATNSWNEFY